jgi:hypothetical protein
LPSVISWLKPVGGDWNTAANWSGGKVPTASDTAVIPFANITVTHSTGTANSVQRLISEAAVNVSAGSLTVGDAPFTTVTTSRIDNTLSVTGSGTVTLQNLTLSGRGTVANSATLTFDSASVNLAVQNNAGVMTADNSTFHSGVPFVNAAAATLDVDDPFGSVATFATGFTNQGTINLGTVGNRGGTVVIPGGTLVNAAGGTINFLTLDLEQPPSVIDANFTNQGTVNGEGNGTIGQAGDTITNSGTISADSTSGENLTVTGTTITNTGTLSAGSGLTLTISGGTFSQSGTLAGPGTISLSGTTANFTGNFSTAAVPLMIENSTFNDTTGTLTNATTLDITGSTINAPLVNDGVLTAGAPLTTVAGSTATVTGPFTNAAGATVTVTGPAALVIAQGFTNQGTITLTSTFTGEDPTLTVTSGTLTNAAGATIQTTGTVAGTAALNAPLVNQGTLTVSEALDINGTVTNSGTVSVKTGDLTVNGTGTSPVFTNTGKLTVSALQGLSVSGGDLTNSGTVTLASFATVNVSGGYTQTGGTTKVAGGIVTVGTQVDVAGGTLSGPGTINGNLLNAAKVAVGATNAPGTLTVTGAYTQTSAGTLTVQVGGTTAGSGFDQLVVSGGATLGGTLTVTLIKGFVPTSGETFPGVTFASATGAFTTVNGTGASKFTVQDNPTNVTLVAK